MAGAKLPVLGALVDRSLLAAGRVGRFSFHPVLRQHAFEKLAPDPEAERRARAAHGHYHLRQLKPPTATAGRPRGMGLSSPATTFADVGAAWRWACAHRPSAEMAQAAAPLTRLCIDHAHYHEGLDLIITALGADTEEAHVGSLATGQLLIQRAALEERLGRYAEAESNAERGLDLLRRHGDAPGRVSGLVTLGNLAVRRGYYAEARKVFRDALASAEAQGLRWEAAHLTENVGLAEQYLGRRSRAAVWYRRALTLRRELDDKHGIVRALANLGNVLRLLAHKAVAQELLEEARNLAVRVGADNVLPNLHINMGVLDLALGRPVEAAADFESALGLARRSGKRGLEVTAAFQLGKLAITLGDARAGQDAFLVSLRLADLLRHREKVLDSVVGLALARAMLGDSERAGRWIAAALDHHATNPGTRRWAGELQQLLDGDERPALAAAVGATVGATVGTAAGTAVGAAIGPAVAAAVASALARSRD